MPIVVYRMGPLINIKDSDTDKSATIMELEKGGVVFGGDYSLASQVYLGTRRSAMDLEEDYNRHHRKGDNQSQYKPLPDDK